MIATLSPSPAVGERGQDRARSRENENSASGTGPEPVSQKPVLRDYQEHAIAAVERELEQNRSTLLVLPTGCGKTVVFAELVRRVVAAGDRALVLAHRGELLDQAAKKLADVGVDSSIDQGSRRAWSHHGVVVASVQTLRGPRLARFTPDAFKLVIVDEAHHAAAASYQTIVQHFTGAKILGVTATPDRGDGKALGKTFDSVAFTYEMRAAIAAGHLAPLVARRVLVDEMDLSAIKTRAGDFAQDELSAMMNADANIHGVVNPLLELGGDRKTLVFGVDVAHAKALAEALNHRKPGRAIALDGTAKAEERAAVLSLFRRGAFQYLCNCALFTEGFDEPDIACVALARPTQSRALYVQMLGRGTRKAPGKTDCLVLDFVGNSGRHRLIGPVDALAGRVVDEKIRAIAEKDLDGQLALEDVLAHAEQEAAAQAKAARAKLNTVALTEYRTREIDLFLGDQMPTFDPDSPEAKRPATAEQLAAIDKAKLGKPPHGISQAEAAAMLEAVRARRALGLCTVAQARALERAGVDTKGMAFERAGVLITLLATRNAWGKPWLVFSDVPEWRRGKKKA